MLNPGYRKISPWETTLRIGVRKRYTDVKLRRPNQNFKTSKIETFWTPTNSCEGNRRPEKWTQLEYGKSSKAYSEMRAGASWGKRWNGQSCLGACKSYGKVENYQEGTTDRYEDAYWHTFCTNGQGYLREHRSCGKAKNWVWLKAINPQGRA